MLESAGYDLGFKWLTVDPVVYEKVDLYGDCPQTHWKDLFSLARSGESIPRERRYCRSGKGPRKLSRLERTTKQSRRIPLRQEHHVQHGCILA
jgi:hypothetical protein